MIWNLRVRVGRWLLWPLTRSVIYHYAEAAVIQGRKGNKREAEHCRYCSGFRKFSDIDSLVHSDDCLWQRVQDLRKGLERAPKEGS